MTQSFFTIIILIFAIGGIVYYLLKIKPHNGIRVKDLYAEGLDLMMAGKRKSAYKNFKDIIQKDSDNIKAYLRLGQVLRESENPSRALKVHKTLYHRRNLTSYEKMDIHKNLALDYFQLGHIDIAISELHNLLKIEKNNEWALSQLSIFYRHNQDWENAGNYLKKFQKRTNKYNMRKLALYKIQEGRILIEKNKFLESRKKFEDALLISEQLAVAYYFIGKSYSSESENAYQRSIDSLANADEKKKYMDQAREYLGKAIPMWIRYLELKPKQAWMVIHLLKDALFALDRYSEFEDILKQVLKNDADNIEVIASLSEIYSHRGEDIEAIELIESALEQDSTSLIVKLIKIKLSAKKEKNSVDFIRSLDDIIHFLVTDERFQIYKNTATDEDIIWLYEASGELES